jgi:group II intron maturase
MAKATERTWEPGAGAEEPLGVRGVERSDGCPGNWGGPPRPGPCGGWEQHRSISGRTAAVDRLNPVLRGWGNYFRHGNSARKFAQIDSYVHERLAILACNKHGLSGRKWVSRFDGAWFARLGVHTLQGTINYGTAHASR